MKAREAADLINGMVFRPGWTLRATVEKPGFLETLLLDLDPSQEFVRVSAEVPTVDTSFPEPDGTYATPKLMTPAAILYTNPMNDVADLVKAIFVLLVMPFQLHEDRELLRVLVDGQWVAPLYPHTDAGIAAWTREMPEDAVLTGVNP